MNKKETKLTSVPSYAFAVLLVSGIFLYIALALGDIFNLFDISHVVSRYIPCFIAGIIGVFVAVKSNIKKVDKEFASEAKIATFVIVFVVAILMLVYLIYGTNEKLSEYVYDNYSQSVVGDFMKIQLEDIKNAQIKVWALSCLSFFVGGAISAFISTRNIAEKMYDSSQKENTSKEILEPAQGYISSNNDSDPSYTPSNDVQSEAKDDNPIDSSPNNNIKWNL